MKKILIVLTLCLALVGATAVPAMAAGPSGTHFPVDESVFTWTGILPTGYFSIICHNINPTQLYLDIEDYNTSDTLLYEYTGYIPSSALKINFSTGTATLNYKITDTTIWNGTSGWNLPTDTSIPADTSINLTWSFNPGDATISYGHPIIVSPGSLAINNGGYILANANPYSPIYLSGSAFGQSINIELAGGLRDGNIYGGENIYVHFSD